MTATADFRDLRRVPKTPDEVIWPGLDQSFYITCREALIKLTEACRDTGPTKTSFYVGAGVSKFKPSELPVAKDVLKDLFTVCETKYQHLKSATTIILAELDRESYVLLENVFQQLYQLVGAQTFKGGLIFDVPLYPPSFNLNHTFLARWLHTGRGMVLTTNLDPLIEHSWSMVTGQPPENLTVIKRPSDYANWKSHIRQPDVLWKLHGSASDRESWAITLSKVGLELRDARATLIQSVVAEQHVCFIGYRAADVDLFPPILRGHTQIGNNATSIFWVFNFNEERHTLEDYLRNEENIALLFQTNPARIYPIVTTAERLCAWLQHECLNVAPAIPHNQIRSSYNYRQWLEEDVASAEEFGITKLVGYTLRVLGKFTDSVDVFDKAAELLQQRLDKISRTDPVLQLQVGDLIQESAHTLWQDEQFAAAWSKVNEAWNVLRGSRDSLARAWCQYGRVTMPLDMAREGKPGVTGCDAVVATLRLIHLHWWFQWLTWWAGSDSHAREGSASVGIGLCTFHVGKILQTICERMYINEYRVIRRLLLNLYTRAEHLLTEAEYVNSIPDVKRRRAYILVSIDQSEAVTAMVEQISIAQIVSRAHLEVAIDRARLLLPRIDDPEAKRRLEKAIGIFPAGLSTT